MNANKILLLLISICAAIQVSSAATIPAGTTLVLKTTESIASRDVAGRPFHGQLILSAGALPVGTKVVGIVQSPRVVIGSITRPLTLQLTQVSVQGRMMPIKTQPFEAHNKGTTGPRGGVRVTGSAFVLPPGTLLQFRLTHPLNI